MIQREALYWEIDQLFYFKVNYYSFPVGGAEEGDSDVTNIWRCLTVGFSPAVVVVCVVTTGGGGWVVVVVVVVAFLTTTTFAT